jgi:hypothetical protein
MKLALFIAFLAAVPPLASLTWHDPVIPGQVSVTDVEQVSIADVDSASTTSVASSLDAAHPCTP